MAPGRASKRTRFRTGDINAAGGKPLSPQVKEYRCVVATQLLTSATTVGDHCLFDIAAYNTPLEMVASTSFTTPVGVSDDRHPSGHQAIIADGYDTSLVLQSHYRIQPIFYGSNTSAPVEARQHRYHVAYKFSLDNTADEPAFPATVATTEAWLDMQATKGWVWSDYRCDWDSGHDPKPININVPNVLQMMKIMRKAQVGQLTMGDFTAAIADSTARPVAGVFLHICVFLTHRSGVPTALTDVGWVGLNIRCTQTVRVWKSISSDEMIDAGDDV